MSALQVVALTGGSGAGKSSIAALLRERGIPVLDCDAIVRALQQPGQRCLSELADAFGQDILFPDGALNRAKLAERGFASQQARGTLNRITHAHVLAELERKFEEMERAGGRVCIVEAGALLESGLEKRCSKIILVTAPTQERLCRILRRDGITEQQALQRLAAQTTEPQLLAAADLVLENLNGSGSARLCADQIEKQLRLWFPDPA